MNPVLFGDLTAITHESDPQDWTRVLVCAAHGITTTEYGSMKVSETRRMGNQFDEAIAELRENQSVEETPDGWTVTLAVPLDEVTEVGVVELTNDQVKVGNQKWYQYARKLIGTATKGYLIPSQIPDLHFCDASTILNLALGGDEEDGDSAMGAGMFP